MASLCLCFLAGVLVTISPTGSGRVLSWQVSKSLELEWSVACLASWSWCAIIGRGSAQGVEHTCARNAGSEMGHFRAFELPRILARKLST